MSAQLILMKGKPSAEFELFWSNYPRKVGRIPASRLWNRLKPPLDEVLEGVKIWQASREWEDPQFIPYPTTFLAQERWRERPVQKVRGKTLYEAINERPAYKADPVTVDTREAAQKVRALLDGLAEKKGL